MIQAPHLKPGDLIGMVCPAGTIPLEKVQNCIKTLESWGYRVQVGETVGAKHFSFGGSDSQRAAELQKMLDDPNIKAILCARGGYGASRIIDQIDFTAFSRQPKWVAGFSDITVLHGAIQKQNIASIHGPMAAAFSKGVEGELFIESLRAILEGRSIECVAKAHEFNKLGNAHARLIGGNLCMIAHLIGSKYEFKTKGKILFIEDIGEYHYNLDRLVLQMKRAGLLESLDGLIVGGFTDMKDKSSDFGASAYEIIQEHTAQYNYPTCYGFPISHDINNFAVKEGGMYNLEITKTQVTLNEA